MPPRLAPPPAPTPPVPTPPPSPATRLAIAKQLVAVYHRMITTLLEITTTPGELGMLGAHEGANWPSAFGVEATRLGIMPNRSYVGTPRIFRPAVRTVVSKSEPSFTIEAAVLSPSPPSTVTLTLTTTASNRDSPETAMVTTDSHPMAPVADQRTGKVHSQLYSVTVPTPQADFDYVISAAFDGAAALYAHRADDGDACALVDPRLFATRDASAPVH